jgi:hypothetical protein
MVMLARLTALGLLIQVVALLSFIAIAKTGLAFPGPGRFKELTLLCSAELTR